MIKYHQVLFTWTNNVFKLDHSLSGDEKSDPTKLLVGSVVEKKAEAGRWEEGRRDLSGDEDDLFSDCRSGQFGQARTVSSGPVRPFRPGWLGSFKKLITFVQCTYNLNNNVQ